MKMLSRHSLLVIAQVDYRESKPGKKALVVIVDRKRGLIALLPSLNERQKLTLSLQHKCFGGLN